MYTEINQTHGHPPLQLQWVFRTEAVGIHTAFYSFTTPLTHGFGTPQTISLLPFSLLHVRSSSFPFFCMCFLSYPLTCSFVLLTYICYQLYVWHWDSINKPTKPHPKELAFELEGFGQYQ